MKRAAFALSGCLVACSPPPAAEPAVWSTSMALSPAEDALWIASPDDDRLVRIDPDTLEVVAWYPVPDAPSHLALLPDGVLVTSALGSAIHRVGPGGVRALPTPCGGTGAVVARADRAVVACPHDDRLLLVDLEAWRVEAVVPSPGRPAALGAWDGRLFVGGATGGVVRSYMWAEGLEPAGEVSLGEAPGISAVQIAAITPDPGGGAFAAVYQRVEHDADRTRPPERGSYGAVFDEGPRIEPRLRAGCGERYARFDGGPAVFSGPSAMAPDEARGRLWVVHRATANLALLDCAAGGASLLASVRLGAGARGIALSRGDGRAWVDLAFDHAVARVDPSGGLTITRRDTGSLRLSPEAERGRRLFHDATNPQITPAGVVSCATCHPDGGDDGLAWFLHTARIPPKLRRTPPAWAGRPTLAPFHYDGAHDDVATLTTDTIQSLMDGPALTLDTTTVAAYLAELPPPPPRPGADADLEARGRALFEDPAVGCAGCHPAPWYTDGAAHDLDLGRDPDRLRGRVQTPTLRGVRARAPYLHDGSAPDLRALLTTRNPADRHGATAHLGHADLAALLAWVETL